MTKDKNKNVGEAVPKFVQLFCPKCGSVVDHQLKSATAKKAGGIGVGAALGAKAGAGIGLAGGPLGAMAGTIPGAIIGGFIGYIGSKKLTNPRCAKCKTRFAV